MCSEVCPPRTSFSYDLDKGLPLQPRPVMLDSTPDFDFTFVSPALGFESFQSSADELFADGMILPIFRNLPAVAPRRPPTAPSLPPLVPDNTKVKVVEVIDKEEDNSGLSTPDSDNVVPKPASRSFWGFKRSASVNNHIADKKGLIFSLPLLARSKSTGSVPNPKRSMQKQPSVKMAKSSSFSASSSSSSSLISSMSGYGNHQSNSKLPPLSRKTSRGQANNGSHKVNNILNLPSPYIIGTANMVGFSSFFCNGKDKKKLKK